MMRKIKSSGDLLHFPGNQLRTGEVAAVARLDNASFRDTPPSPKKSTKPIRIPRPPRQKRMLDLFSGTGIVGETFAKLGYLVYSVDIDPRLHPSIVVDVTVWQYWKCFPPCVLTS